MSDTLQATKGSCISFEALWQDEAGPINLFGSTVSIVEAAPPILATAQIRIEGDPVDGRTVVEIDETIAPKLQYGRFNRMRIARTLTDGCVETSPTIWIEIL